MRARCDQTRAAIAHQRRSCRAPFRDYIEQAEQGFVTTIAAAVKEMIKKHGAQWDGVLPLAWDKWRHVISRGRYVSGKPKLKALLLEMGIKSPQHGTDWAEIM